MSNPGKSHTTILLALVFAAAILLQSYYIADRNLATTIMFVLIGGWFAIDNCLRARDERCRVKVRVRRPAHHPNDHRQNGHSRHDLR